VSTRVATRTILAGRHPRWPIKRASVLPVSTLRNVEAICELLRRSAELQVTADKFEQSWQKIANSAAVSLADQRKAFDQWAAAATAANGGVGTSAVKAARAQLEIKEAALGAGEGIETGMRRGGAAVDDLSGRLVKVRDTLIGIARDAGNIGGNYNATVKSNSTPNKYNSQGVAVDASGQPIVITGQLNIPAGSFFDKAAFDVADAAFGLRSSSPLVGSVCISFCWPLHSSHEQ